MRCYVASRLVSVFLHFCNISHPLCIILLKGLSKEHAGGDQTWTPFKPALVSADGSIPLPDSIDIRRDEDTGKISVNEEVTRGNEDIEIYMVLPTPLP